MTISVTVKTRNWPALVKLTSAVEGDEGHEVETGEETIPANETKTFHIDETAGLEIREIAPEHLTEAEKSLQGDTNDDGVVDDKDEPVNKVGNVPPAQSSNEYLSETMPLKNAPSGDGGGSDAE